MNFIKEKKDTTSYFLGLAWIAGSIMWLITSESIAFSLIYFVIGVAYFINE